jgi:Methyltransferase domain
MLNPLKYLRTLIQHNLGISLKNRKDIPYLLRILNLNGKGVEIGVCKGDYSKILLEKSNLSTLFSVDPWQNMSADIYWDRNNVPQDENEERYQNVVREFKKYGDKSKILRMTSKDASPQFQDGELEFVYIDGNHSYEACKEDIQLWWPKVKKGGLFAGHDYVDGKVNESEFGVKSAVDEFVKANNQTLFVNPQPFPTWYLQKK